MTAFQIQPVADTALPDVAKFLYKWHTNDGAAVQHPFRKAPHRIERCLRWLLLENPWRNNRHGFCIRDASGAVRGLSLNFPSTFLAGGRRLAGLGSGSFFVEEQARGLGILLFKKYLNSPGYSFFFATTCNGKSSALFQKMGANSVPGSEIEYLFPLRLEVILPGFVAKKTSNAFAAKAASNIGRCLNPVLKLLAHGSPTLKIEPSRDWEKLSALSRRHTPASFITCDRSVEFLQWRYGSSSPNNLARICLFGDKQGNEGWFSLGNTVRGRQGEIRACTLLDLVWPNAKVTFSDILPLILEAAGGADAIYFTPRAGIDYSACSRWIIPIRLEAPRIWVQTAKGAEPLDVSFLDFVPADGDSAWSNRYENEFSEPGPAYVAGVTN